MNLIEPKTKRDRKPKKVGVVTSVAFVSSVGIHLLLCLFVGGAVVFQGDIPIFSFNSNESDFWVDDTPSEFELPLLMEEEMDS